MMIIFLFSDFRICAAAESLSFGTTTGPTSEFINSVVCFLYSVF
jgi:hypothetical protein